MVLHFLLRSVFLPFLAVSCLEEDCQRTEQTRTINKERINQWGGYEGIFPVTEVISVQYICSNVILPLSFLKETFCDSCRSSLFISSLSNGTIPPLSFTDYNFFNEIRMNNLGIKEILPAAFNSLNHLKQLHLSKNEILRLPDGLLNSLTELEILDISSNKLEIVSKHFLTGLQNLQLLNLSSNFLVDFDASILYTNNNIQIDLSFNRLTKFEFESSSNSIQYYNLSHNIISEITGCFSMIEIIKLDNNKLDNIKNITCDDSFPIISELNLGYNSLTELHSGSFDSISSLNYLHLENNNLSVLQTDIFANLSSLKVLNLSNNHLKDFQHGVFEHVQNLKYLDLSGNEFWTTKRYFHSLSNLQELDLSNNCIRVFDASQIVVDLPVLKKISLDGNKLFCEDLINIMQIFRDRIYVKHGKTKSSNNIHGIACNASMTDLQVIASNNDNNSEKKNSIFFEIKHLLENHEQNDNFMYDFFNSGFKESKFYKYLENIQRDESLRFNESDIFNYFDRDFKNSPFFKFFDNFKYPVTLNNSIIDYFNKDFRNSGFIKYLENLQQSDDFLSKSFDQSVFYNFFNRDFRKTQFYQYLENITSRKLVHYIEKEDPKFEKIVNIPEVEDHKDNYYGILVVVVILLAMLVLIGTVLLVISLKLYFISIKNNIRIKEQVELIES